MLATRFEATVSRHDGNEDVMMTIEQLFNVCRQKTIVQHVGHQGEGRDDTIKRTTYEDLSGDDENREGGKPLALRIATLHLTRPPSLEARVGRSTESVICKLC